MGRFKTCAALVLRTRQTGESNREASLLTADLGLLWATVYGGAKSKLRAAVSPFHSGIFYLYHDPVRGSYKVSDFDAQVWRMGIREQYERAMAGSAIAETILAGYGGGAQGEEAYIQAGAAFDALENAEGAAVPRILTQFLWRWTDITGVRPDMGAAALPRRFPGALDWLRRAERITPEALAAHPSGEGILSDERALSAARGLCAEILAGAYGRKLALWTTL